MRFPKLTDEAVSELPLAAGRAELLEEIMSTPVVDAPVTREPQPASRRARWLVPIAVAAAVATVASSPLWWGAVHDSGRDPGPDSGRGSVSAAGQLDLPHGQGVVLDAPGWKVDSLSSDGIQFRKGGAELEVTAYDAKDYDSYVTDREHITEQPSPGQPIQVLGLPALMWAYSAHDHTAIRGVEGGRWMELRGQGMDQAAYLALLGQLRLASEAEFDATLPADYVDKSEREITAEQLLSEIQAVSRAGYPRGETPSFVDGDAKDRYQFGAEVAGSYACAWLGEFENAKAHGQSGPAAEAARVLGTSRQWPILKQMNADGDYPEVLWDYADQVDAGQVPDGYREGLGC